MSITSGATRKAGPFNGNGVTVAFPFSFKVFTTADVLVVQTDLSGVETTKALTTDYTVSLNANQDSNPGGTVTMLVAPPTNYLLTIGSKVDYTQTMVLTNGGGFFPTVLNDMADRCVILIQQAMEKLTRAFSLPFSAPANVSAQVPLPVAGSALKWNPTGTALVNSTYDPDTQMAAAAASAATATAQAGIATNQAGIATTQAGNAAAAAAAAANTPVAAPTHAAVSKATPADADEIPLLDSAASFILSKLTFANLKAALGSTVQTQKATAFTTAGTSTAYTLTPSPAISANAQFQRFRVAFHTAAGTSPTLSVSGQTALALKYRDITGTKTPVSFSQVPAGWISDVENDGVDWVVLQPANTGPISATYKFTDWNPVNLTGGNSPSPNTGTATNNNNLISMANSAGTLTFTFLLPGSYLVSISEQTTHANTYTASQLLVTLGGTATRYLSAPGGIFDNGQGTASTNTNGGATFLVTTSAANQTLTVYGNYVVTGSGTTAQHTASLAASAMWAGA